VPRPPAQVTPGVPHFGSVGLLMIRENRAPNPSLERVQKAVKR